MKVTNITDVETPLLQTAERVNLPVMVRGRRVAPGESVDVPAVGADELRWQRLGVLFFGDLTKEYVAAKAAKPVTPTGPVKVVPPPRSAPAPAPVKPRGEEDISALETLVPKAPIEEAERFDGKPVPAADATTEIAKSEIETVVAAGPPAPEMYSVEDAPTQPVKTVKGKKKSKNKKGR